jgi:hypothetical protein
MLIRSITDIVSEIILQPDEYSTHVYIPTTGQTSEVDV